MIEGWVRGCAIVRTDSPSHHVQALPIKGEGRPIFVGYRVAIKVLDPGGVDPDPNLNIKPDRDATLTNNPDPT